MSHSQLLVGSWQRKQKEKEQCNKTLKHTKHKIKGRLWLVVGKENKKNSAMNYKNIQNTKSDGEIMSHSQLLVGSWQRKQKEKEQCNKTLKHTKHKIKGRLWLVVGKENKKNSAMNYKNIQNTKSDGEIMSHSQLLVGSWQRRESSWQRNCPLIEILTTSQK